MRPILFSLAVLAAPALAQETCPAVPDLESRYDEILQGIADAPDADAARQLSDRLWQLWVQAPDETAQELLDEGMARREAYDFLGSIEVLDRLVAYCPDYAEGWNQRAFASFLRQDYAPALADLDRALAINPRHIAALTGKALTLMGLGRDDEAQTVLRTALGMNSWLAEGALLREPPGQEL